MLLLWRSLNLMSANSVSRPDGPPCTYRQNCCYFSAPDLARLGAPVTVALPEHLAGPGIDDADGLVLGRRRE